MSVRYSAPEDLFSCAIVVVFILGLLKELAGIPPYFSYHPFFFRVQLSRSGIMKAS